MIKERRTVIYSHLLHKHPNLAQIPTVPVHSVHRSSSHKELDSGRTLIHVKVDTRFDVGACERARAHLRLYTCAKFHKPLIRYEKIGPDLECMAQGEWKWKIRRRRRCRTSWSIILNFKFRPFGTNSTCDHPTDERPYNIKCPKLFVMAKYGMFQIISVRPELLGGQMDVWSMCTIFCVCCSLHACFRS